MQLLQNGKTICTLLLTRSVNKTMKKITQDQGENKNCEKKACNVCLYRFGKVMMDMNNRKLSINFPGFLFFECFLPPLSHFLPGHGIDINQTFPFSPLPYIPPQLQYHLIYLIRLSWYRDVYHFREQSNESFCYKSRYRSVKIFT